MVAMNGDGFGISYFNVLYGKIKVGKLGEF